MTKQKAIKILEKLQNKHDDNGVIMQDLQDIMEFIIKESTFEERLEASKAQDLY